MEMIQQQIERRRDRAAEDIAAITNRGKHKVYSTFDVTSNSGRAYQVQIHSLTELLNNCTCADYQTNLIGTCKHIEAVLLNLQDSLGKEWDKMAAAKPPLVHLYLHQAESATVRMTLPLPGTGKLREVLLRYFDADGTLLGAPLLTLPRLLDDLNGLTSAQKTRLQVSPEIGQYVTRLQEIDSVERQKEWFLEQVQRGNRTLDVISAKLYPYQEEGAMHLALGRRGLLADDMGLGKTVQAIAASSLLHQLRDIKRVLVICPASLKHQWLREIQRFTSFTAQTIQGNQIARRHLYQDPKFFNILNYELVMRDEEELRRLKPDLIILDEAQRIKNWRTKTADSVKRLQSPYAFVLTGTPLENRLDELYSVFQFIDPNILGPLWRFNQRFFQVERRKSGSYKVLGYKNLDELRQLIDPYVVRRVREEVLTDLPSRIDNNFFVEMTDKQWHAYEEYRYQLAKLVAISHRRPLNPKERQLLLLFLMKMRLIGNALALHDPELSDAQKIKHAPKLGELASILKDEVLDKGNKAIIFSQWTNMIELAYPVLDKLGIGYVTLSGKVPTPKRGALVERFFEDDNCKVFFSTDAGGVGLNLQAASLIVNLDLPWNPAVLDQRIARAHRHGQKNTVNVINLIAKGTIEERMLDTIAAKRDVFAGVFGGEESPAEISFNDTGQSLIQKVDEMLGAPPPEVKLDLAPDPNAEGSSTSLEQGQLISSPPNGASGTSTPQQPQLKPRPTLRDFAKRLVDLLPQRIQLVRHAPQLPGVMAANGASGESILVVVDQAPGDLRAQIQAEIDEHFTPIDETIERAAPALHLMDRESYQTLIALTGGAIEKGVHDAVSVAAGHAGDAYRAPSMPAPVEDKAAARKAEQVKKARTGLDKATKRLALARVVLQGGFPEEVMRPIHQALGWALTGHLSLVDDREPSEELPSPRLVNAQLVEAKRIESTLAARLSNVRELTAPLGDDEDEAPPPSVETAESLILTVQEVVDRGLELIAEDSL